MDEIKPKARPGRPRKKAATPAVPIGGISPTPKDTANYMELTYSDPKLFKKVFSVFKTYACEKIHMVFDEKIHFVGIDHTQRCHVYCDIDPRTLNHYYCGGAVTITVVQKEIERIFNTFDKNLLTATLLIDNENRNSLIIVTTDNEMAARDTSSVEQQECDYVYEEPIVNHTTKFTLNSKHFKKKIGDIIKIANEITFSRGETETLQVSSNNESRGTIRHDTSYSDLSKIKYEGNETYCFTLRVKYIKPFSSANIGSDVDIAIDTESRSVVLSTTADRRGDGYVFKISVVLWDVQFV